jgi:hypothetical protein
MSKAPICDYCGNSSVLTSSKEVYGGRDYGPIYLCRCQLGLAYVGCHKGTTVPLGRLANPELRKWKKLAHDALDPLWKRGKMARSECYAWLAKELQIQPKDCHIGMFDVEMCERVHAICTEFVHEH